MQMGSFQSKLSDAVDKNNSMLCIGLDPDSTQMPASVAGKPEALFEFNKAIIDATADLVCAYKPNSAFYERSGAAGIEQLYKTCHYILDKYPNLPIILDAKRADIGSTNESYADYAFDYLGADGITLNPYLGKEALQPFLDYKDKGQIILCRTSNPGAGELQDLKVDGQELYKIVAANVAKNWNTNQNCLLVVGATYPDELAEVRQIVGQQMTLLVPGIGAQGGELEATLKAGLNTDGIGLIISSSRDIIYASTGVDFAQAARAKAQELKDKINSIRQGK